MAEPPFRVNASQLAHPVTSDENFEILILIGEDQYWDKVKDMVIRGQGPTAVDSKLGYLISRPLQTNCAHRTDIVCFRTGEKHSRPSQRLSNRLNSTFEACYCLTQHVIRSCHKCMREYVKWKVLYDGIAILKYSLVIKILFLVCLFVFVSPIP